ncbi:hypothetical protein [Actinoplanes missouriensis]|uniref:hypothetical protein n=1 Tax=Actinoplanes missouriensis TaxID=1866 RepID=UPI0012F96FCB|nr:hypothetical protein [Actinoplanes missouriensis]
MSTSWGWALSLVSALAATLTGVVVGARLSQRWQLAQWSRASSLEACTGLLRAYAAVYDGMSHGCRHRIEPSIDWTNWNQALAAASLSATAQIVEAAVALDDVVWAVDAKIVKGHNGLDEWLVHRKLLESARLNFINVVRSELAVDHKILDRAVGSNRGSGHSSDRYERPETGAE